MDLAQVKQVSRYDLQDFLRQDYTSFSVLNVMLKSILSTGRTTVTLSKNSAQSFYLNQPKNTSASATNSIPEVKDDCLTDAQNCDFFQFFNRKEKRLYIRFLDKVEANFEGKAANQPLLFLTLTFNTTQNNLATFTTNWEKTDSCWERLQGKKPYDLRAWAAKFDSDCESMKVLLKKISREAAADFTQASHYISKFLRDIRLKWKPNNWKWAVVAELQKNGNWHFHLISTPIVPYAHRCNLDKHFQPCWNCRAYLSELWPYGRVESRSPGYKTISKYLAKYLAKSFHLRKLYREHGFQEHNKAYRFFKNLYQYEERSAIIENKSRRDQATGKYLPPNQKVFRRVDNTYFYRTNEQLVGSAAKPLRLSKNFQLGNHSLTTRELLQLAQKDPTKAAILLNKPPGTVTKDFQIFLITSLLLMAHKAEFVKIPCEKNQVPKLGEQCDQSLLTHFQTKPVLQFTFKPVNSQLVQQFFEKIDHHALDYGITEAQEFTDSRFPDPSESRNAYLNRWQTNIAEYQTNRQLDQNNHG